MEEPTINSSCCEFGLSIGLVLLKWLFMDVELIEVVHMWLYCWTLSWQNWTKTPTLDVECIFCLLHVHCVVCKKTYISSDICGHFSYGNMCKVGICMKRFSSCHALTTKTTIACALPFPHKEIVQLPYTELTLLLKWPISSKSKWYSRNLCSSNLSS